MGDFVLDFRLPGKRATGSELSRLAPFPDMHVWRHEDSAFSLSVSYSAAFDDEKVWGPCVSKSDSIVVALVGRVAADEEWWGNAEREPPDGGIACKGLLREFKDKGPEGLAFLDGHFTVIAYDGRNRELFVVTDRCGMCPCFVATDSESTPILSSQPDLVAKLAGEAGNLDMVSMAEFLTCGRLYFPNTYYARVKALDYGSIHRYGTAGRGKWEVSSRRYYEVQFALDPRKTQAEAATELASAFRVAVGRRVLPLLGKAGISLSGGLDSRAILCCVPPASDALAFSFYDRENTEFRTARAIARAVGAEFVPLQRKFDHYGSNALAAVRISGAMGDLANNHFLGFRDSLVDMGVKNLIPGFYCDYLFKGLVLNHRRGRITRREIADDFDYQVYQPVFWQSTAHGEAVRDRLELVFPEKLRMDRSPYGRLLAAHRRIFPLCYEPDNMETTVPLRVMGLYLPTIDREMLEVYSTTPPMWRLNGEMYSKAVGIICGPRVSAIQDANTGAAVNAPIAIEVLSMYWRALQTKLSKTGIWTSGSWQNWEYYRKHSTILRTLWNDSPREVHSVLSAVVGEQRWRCSFENPLELPIKLYLRLLTLKLWLRGCTS